MSELMRVPLDSMDPVDWLVYADNLEDFPRGRLSPQKCRRIGFVLSKWQTGVRNPHFPGCFLPPSRWLLLHWTHYSPRNVRFVWNLPSYMAGTTMEVPTRAGPFKPYDKSIWTNPVEEPRCHWSIDDWYDRRTAWKFFANIASDHIAMQLLTKEDYEQYRLMPRPPKPEPRQVLIGGQVLRTADMQVVHTLPKSKWKKVY